jgi:hypothetical protein
MNNTQMPFNGWIANLSDGSNVHETPPAEGEKSAWQKLIDQVSTNKDLSISQLHLVRNGRVIHAINSKGSRGYFQAYDVTRVLWSDTYIRKQVIGSVVGDMVFITWIDEKGEIWQDARSLETEKVHTTLRDTDDDS